MKIRIVNRLLAAGILLCTACFPVAAQTSKPQYPTFLKTGEVPLFERYLPPPPSLHTAAFAADSVAYEDGFRQRQSERGLAAIADADVSPSVLLDRFLTACGFNADLEKLPHLKFLIERVSNDAYQGISGAKRRYRRLRPFVFFGEPTSIPAEENSHRATFSYPSTHSSIGWAVALVLSELIPERQNDLLAVGYEIGQSRVITGYHYQSDVDAARLSAAAVVARLHANADFHKALKRAKREIKQHCHASSSHIDD